MALTKVTGQVIKNTTDVTVGVLTVTNTLAVGGTVSIGGTLTYEDVTNVDAVGLITARNGIVVGSGITLSKDGDIFATGVCTATSFSGSGANLTGIDTDLVSDTSPQLGGDLDSNGNNILLDDSDEIRFGTDNDLAMSHNGSHGYIINKTGELNVYSKAGEAGLVLVPDGTSKLYYDGSKKFETSSAGGTITGTLTATGQLTGSSSNSGKYVRLYGGAGTGRWDIYGHGANLRFSDNDSAGVIQFDTDVTIADKLVHTGDTDTALRFPAADTITAETGGSERLRITSDGRLGVGIVAPTKLLDIATSTSADGIRVRSTGNTYNDLSFDANRTSANTHIARIISHWNGTAVSYISMDAGSDTTNKDDGMIRFWTANGSGNYERLRITSAGKVGINKTSPVGNLEVSDTSSNVPLIRIETSDGGNKRLDLKVENSDGIISSEQSAQQLHLKSTSNTTFSTNGSERLRILAAGGLTFNGDTAAANALDDYEEGTSTPDFANADNSIVTVNHYHYTKVGRLVHFEAKFTVGSNSDGSGFGFSLPFNQAGSRETVIPAISTRSSPNNPFSFVINANQSYAYAHALQGYSGTNVEYQDFAGSVILISGTYEAN